MSTNLKNLKSIIEYALQLEQKKTSEDAQTFILKSLKAHPDFEALLKNINQKVIEGTETPVMYAIRKGANVDLFEVLERISNEEADKEYQSRYRPFRWVRTPYRVLNDKAEKTAYSLFLIAVESNNRALVDALIKKGMNPREKNADGMTALHIAAEKGHTALVEHLIETYNLDPFAEDNKKRSLFYIADVTGNTELKKFLKQYEGSHKKVNELLARALKIQQDAEALKKLFESDQAKFLKESINVKFHGLNAPQLALRMGANFALMETLIGLSQTEAKRSKGYYDVINDTETRDGCNLVQVAAKLNKEDLLTFLLKNKAEINSVNKFSGRTPLHFALKSGQPNSVNVLLKNTISPLCQVNVLDRRGRSTLIYAIQYGREDMIQTLVELSKKQAWWGSFNIITQPDNHRATPLHYAAKNPKHKGACEMIVKILMSQNEKTKINAQDNKGLTPLHYAAAAGNLAVVEILINNGADIHALSNFKLTPLLLAAKQGQLHIVEYLLSITKSEKDVLALDNRGFSLLDHAISSGNETLVKTILDSSFGPTLLKLRDKRERTPLHIAARTNHLGITKLLLERAPEQLDHLDIHGETPLRYAIMVARTHKHDYEGTSLKTIAFLRNEMNDRIKKKEKERAEQILKNAYPKHTVYLVAEQQQKIASNPSLSEGLLQNVATQEGRLALHKVHVLYEGKGFHCYAFVPETTPKGKPIDVKIVFSAPKRTKESEEDILDDIRHLNNFDALQDNMEGLLKKTSDVLVKLKKEHPESAQTLSISGRGMLGDDAQYFSSAILKAIDQDKNKRFEKLKNVRLTTLNAPKVNKELATQTEQLIKKLNSEKRLDKIESNHLMVEGSFLPLLGGSYIFGEKSAPATVQLDAVQDTKLTKHIEECIPKIKENMLKREKLIKEIKIEKNKLDAIELERQKQKKEAERAGSTALVSTRELKLSRDLEDKLRYLETTLSSLEEEIHEEMGLLKDYENQALNLSLQTANYEPVSSFKFNSSQLKSITFYKPLVELWFLQLGQKKPDENQSDKLERILQTARSAPQIVTFSPKEWKEQKERKDLKEHKEEKERAESEFRLYEPLFEQTNKFKRGKSEFEQIYASGEYLFHHVTYQNLNEGDIVPVLSDTGEVVQYKAHPLIHLRGMVGAALTPLHGKGDVKLLFRGTTDLDSAIRDLSGGGAGYHSFINSQTTLLSRLNQVFDSEIKRLKSENLSQDLTVSIGGHSLGGADAQQCFVLLLKALGWNKYEKSQPQVKELKKDLKDNKDQKDQKEQKETKEPKESKDTMDKDFALQAVLGEKFPVEIRDSLSSIKAIRLQTYNAPGVSKKTANQGLQLAKFLTSTQGNVPPIKLSALYQRVGGDAVQQAGEAHLFEKAPKSVAEVEVLKFTDYYQFSKLNAHQHKQFTREIEGRKDENLPAGVFERFRNDESGNIVNKAGTLEFNDKLEPDSSAFKTIKATLEFLLQTYLQDPKRSTGRRV